MRIVSLNPSATELVCALGLQADLVAVSHECDFPESVKALPRVTAAAIDYYATSADIDAQVRSEAASGGSLYSILNDVMAEVRPELIVTQSLCDVCAVADTDVIAAANALAEKPTVLSLQPSTIDDLFTDIARLGAATETEQQASVLTASLQQRLQRVGEISKGFSAPQRPRVAFVEWVDPPFSAGHWTPELIAMAGGEPLLAHPATRSQTLSWQEVLVAAPDHLIICCCGFDAERGLVEVERLHDNRAWRELSHRLAGKIHIIDGNVYFNRPGPRLVDSVELLAHCLHPKVHPRHDYLIPAVAYP